MGLLNYLKGRNNNSSINDEEKTMIPVMESTECTNIEESTIVAQSEIPASTIIGNLTFDKQYEAAIQEGLKQLKKNPYDAGVHINLMVAYYKARDINSEYFDKSSYHAKMAILNGHHTGYAEERLAKNLDKQKKYHQTIQLCDLVLRDDFHFSAHGCGNKIDFSVRREKALQKINKASDDETSVVFTSNEIEKIINDIRETDKRNTELQTEYALLEKKINQAMSLANYKEADRIMKRMSEISSQIVY